ncbi:MAG: CRISPR-associated endonuclease Cas2 [Candidatus Edwardsbacteria bacterium]|nr:CRISPR-associated endonuclease Cas2 [Candidatus Edwardsbacteria bacterium]
MNSDHFVLVSYDVVKDGRRNKIATILEDYGRRLQYSVFECELDREHLDEMRLRLLKIYCPEEDKIGFYHLCRDCVKRREFYGEHEEPEEPEVYIF